MKSRLSLAAVSVVALAAVIAPSATANSAKTASSIIVTTTYDEINLCLSAPDVVSTDHRFKAKIKKKGTTNPKKVVVTYKVTDLTTGILVIKEKLTLKPKKYTKVGSSVLYTAGHQYQYDYVSVYRAPNTGKNVKAKSKRTDTIPSVESLAALGLPACAAG
ncbi:MAG: hypothetical protein JHC87_03640 [Thermoleophilaceae bacterium]|nr:hypothetical protein [Thermoleophilaceae bacterium]